MEYLKQVVSDQASDLFLVAGVPASEKLEGRIRPIDDKKLKPADTEQLVSEIYTMAGRPMTHYTSKGDDDFPLQ